jgi:hypothetical protein
MQRTSVYVRPLAPDLAVVAGVVQAGAAVALFFAPAVETCVGIRLLSYFSDIKLSCGYASVIDVYGFSLNGPTLGLALLLISGLMLFVAGRGHKPDLQRLWLWCTVGLNGVGLILAWMVFIWFLPTTACALWAALALGRGQERRSHGLQRRAVRVRRL